MLGLPVRGAAGQVGGVTDRIERAARFTVLPEELTLDPEVTDRALRVWARLDRYAGRDDSAYPSVEALARDLNCSPRSIKRATQNLRETGWLTRKQRRSGSAVYTLQIRKGHQ